jgi:peptide deformylase
MTARPILTVPNPILKQISTPVAAVDDAIRALMDEMLESMYEAKGIGLAAVQIGEPVRVIVMDLEWGKADAPDHRAPRFFVNPEIIWRSDDLAPYEEGCLSVPEYYDDVERPAKVRLRYLNRDNELVEEDAEGMFATCIQHEMDHLNGVLLVDHFEGAKREQLIRQYETAQAAKNASKL